MAGTYGGYGPDPYRDDPTGGLTASNFFTMPDEEFEAAMARTSPERAQNIRTQRVRYFQTPEGQQARAQSISLQMYNTMYPQLVRGELPQGAQAGVDAEMQLIMAELNRRGIQGEQQITNNLARRGMLNSSLYANQMVDMNSAIVRQLAQSRQDVTQRAIGNLLAALGFGGQTQSALAGQQLEMYNARTARIQANSPSNYIPDINVGQVGG